MTERIEHAAIRRLMQEEAQLVEVLPAAEFAEVHLPGATNIPLKQLERDSTAGLDRLRSIVVYCWDSL